MILLTTLLLLLGQRVPGPEPLHPEWGPQPPIAPYGEQDLPSERVVVPLVFPVLGKSRWNDGYGEERGGFKHTGIDIRAPKMTPIVAPFSGVIGLKRESFWIYGDNGYAMLGTHLNDDNLGTSDHKADRDLMFAPGLQPGQHVSEGQFIGYIGESGDATAPHLHFEIYAPASGRSTERIRNAYPSLQHAKVIGAPIPVSINPGDLPRAGEVKVEGCIRKIDEGNSTITLILLGTESAGETERVVTKPTWRKFKLSESEIKELGGWQTLSSYPAQKVMAMFVRYPVGTIALVNRIGLPAGVKISAR